MGGIEARAADTVSTAPAAASTAKPGGIFSAEVFGGYFTGTAGEYVYNVPGDRSKVSQLDWQIDGAAIIGVRVIFKPLDWLEVKGAGFTVLDSDNAMDDFDWLAGYDGFDSWTHWSHSKDTQLAKFYQVDASAAAQLFDAGRIRVSGIAGYRFQTFKMNAYGGSYIYSSEMGFRDVEGSFPPGLLGIAYQQWWHTPYLGLGVRYTGDNLTVNAEVIGSPFVMAHDKDHHNLRGLVFEEAFAPDRMLGAALGVEYALTDSIALTGRVEYQKFLEARGSTRIKTVDGLAAHLPKPSAGADLTTLALTFGLKAGF
ncbi:omptin family outer membrane protease [Microvirga roseola]|uniref:omptin family outer membrane protease n=1 Tax=Microvirga roseola TaxID=2883126 RepID=UPI001E5E0402|nr:omptin family outer membrane protease [Microvirga roseola]